MSLPTSAPRPHADAHETSTGHELSTSDWLDVHYLAAEPEYLAIRRSVGLQPGWHVLDAGCGSGSFLAAIADLLGPSGRISALDLAPENVAAIERRLQARSLACAIELRMGDLRGLPFPDQSFDAVWSANVSQYLTDEELMEALAECARILKPGGLLAIKETEATAMQILPIPPELLRQIYGRAKFDLLRLRVLHRSGPRSAKARESRSL